MGIIPNGFISYSKPFSQPLSTVATIEDMSPLLPPPQNLAQNTRKVRTVATTPVSLKPTTPARYSNASTTLVNTWNIRLPTALSAANYQRMKKRLCGAPPRTAMIQTQSGSSVPHDEARSLAFTSSIINATTCPVHNVSSAEK